ncbi:hypothetical protein V6U89_29830 [Micromonospora sp. CPCC 206171]|uniref:hypothetical protein n=1 Tax=Micromonospora sp. CPCC 206171 TaxID=3122405 RepID=UPI002FEE7B6A
MTTYKVIGICTVAGKKRGEVVELDPELINIEALVEAGHIEPVTARPGKKEASK